MAINSRLLPRSIQATLLSIVLTTQFPFVARASEPSRSPLASGPAHEEARALYEEAERSLANSDFELAEKQFELLVSRHSTTPEAAAALEMLEYIAEVRSAAMRRTVGREPKGPSWIGRLELVAFTGLFGASVGFEAASRMELVSPHNLLPYSGGWLLVGAGTALGALGAWVVTIGREVTMGTSAMWGLGLMVGLYDTFLVGELSGTGSSLLPFVGSAAGGLIALGVQYGLELDGGAAGLVAAGAHYGTFAAAMTTMALGRLGLSTAAVMATLLAGTNLGIVGGALAAAFVETTRSHVLLAELTGATGGLLAAAVTSVVSDAPGSDLHPAAEAAVISAGVAGGTLLAVWALAELVEDDGTGPLSLGLPAPMPLAGADGGLALGVKLLDGRF